MQVQRVAVGQFRRFEQGSWEPLAGINLLLGENGIGKTSYLEALHLISHGRSFRGRVRDGLIRQGEQALEVFVQWQDPTGQGGERRGGLRHSGQDWSARLDGEDVAQLGQLCAALAVVTFEPGSHVLISGGSEPRRRFLDWGLFHVEPGFTAQWRRYSRALKQRNALLKQGASRHTLAAWDHELAQAGEPLTTARQHYLARLQDQLLPLAERLAPSLQIRGLEFHPGWKRQEMPLADALLLAQERDRQQGFTSVGPHRADWSVGYAQLSGREVLSRGQAKLTALACLLAQAADFAGERGHWPVLCLDDLGSELDRHHQGRILDYLQTTPAQVLITATEMPAAFDGRPIAMFHVEHDGMVASEGGQATLV
ncbi:MAG: DNA replication/repair protein RecF [Stenotrophomonas sp.]